MAGATVEFDLRELDGLARLLNGARLDDGGRERLLGDIGVEMAAATQARIAGPEKRDPQGNPWKALAEKTREYYAKYLPGPRSLLWGKGGLLDSVTSKAGGPWSVLVGAAREYAAVHQFGWPEKNIPAQPYLGVSAEDAADIAAITRRFLARRFGS